MSMNHAYSNDLMKANPHYQELFRQHEELEETLKGLKHHPAAAPDEIQRLKKMKLCVVDQMRALEFRRFNS